MAKGDPCRWCGNPSIKGRLVCRACASPVGVCKKCSGPYLPSRRGCRWCVVGPVTHKCKMCRGTNNEIKSWQTKLLCDACDRRRCRNGLCKRCGRALLKRGTVISQGRASPHAGRVLCTHCQDAGDIEVCLVSPDGREKIVFLPQRSKIIGQRGKELHEIRKHKTNFRVTMDQWISGLPSVVAKEVRCSVCAKKLLRQKNFKKTICRACLNKKKALLTRKWVSKACVPRDRVCKSCQRSDYETKFTKQNICMSCAKRIYRNGRCVVCGCAISAAGDCTNCDLQQARELQRSTT